MLNIFEAKKGLKGEKSRVDLALVDDENSSDIDEIFEALEELKTSGIRKRDDKLLRKVKSSPTSPDTGKILLAGKFDLREK